MNRRNSELYFLYALLAGVCILAFFIFKPFIYTLILAIVFATVFSPVHKKILALTGQARGLTALLTSIFILVIVIVPISFLVIQIFQEASQLYFFLASNEGSTVLSTGIGNIIHTLQNITLIPSDFSFDINEYARQGLDWVLPHLSLLISNIAHIAISIFIFLVALYYLFKDGHTLKKILIRLSPLQDTYDESIFSKLALAINSVVKGSIVVALIQGALTALGFWIFGVPNAILWGTIAALASLIPGFGTALVIIPAILSLFFSGSIFLALGLLIWGIVAVGLIDNFLGPKLVEQGVRIHPFLILLSILGGLTLFGPVGFLLGPLVLSLLFALLEIYGTIRSSSTIT